MILNKLLVQFGILVTVLLAGCNPAPDSETKAAAFNIDNHPGKTLFTEHCASCHEGGVEKAPHREFLKQLSPAAILAALNTGAMRQQAAELSQAQRRQIAEFLTVRDLAQYRPPPPPKMCSDQAAGFDMSQAANAVGWGHDTARFIPGAIAKLPVGDVSRLKLKWAFGFPEATKARSQPAIAFGAVFVGSQDGTVYALDLETGCARWTSKVAGEIRTAIVIEPGKKTNPRLFFGDFLGRIHALDAKTGKNLWSTRPDGHANATITGTPSLQGDTLFVPISSLEVVTAADPNYACCTFRGSLAALDVGTGRVRWKHYTIPQEPRRSGVTPAGTARLAPSGAPVWGSPAYDAKRGVVYLGSGENYQSPADGNSDALIAVDARSGARRWTFQLTAGDAWNVACMLEDRSNCPVPMGPDFDIGASPILVTMKDGSDIVVVGQKSGMIYGVDPVTGKPKWSQRAGRGGIQGGIHFGMAAYDGVIYVGINDVQMRSDGSKIEGKGEPGLVALDARTGRILWRIVDQGQCLGKRSCGPGISAAVTAIPDVVFAGYLDGTLRAHDSTNGRFLWQAGTAREFQTVNATPAHGGSLGGPGVAVGNGYVITNSGYGFSDHMPGNALLVFSVDGK